MTPKVLVILLLSSSVAVTATAAVKHPVRPDATPHASRIARTASVESAPPLWTDRDGPWPSAGRTVFRIADEDAARAAGLSPTRRPGWFVVDDTELLTGSVRATAARTLARYSTPALIDRLGGLAWPDAAMLVGFRDGTTPADRNAALAAAGGRVERYSALANLVLVRLEVATGREVLDRVAAVAAHPAVAFAEPDLAITGRAALVPSDPSFPTSWGHRNTGQDAGLAGFDLKSTLAWDLGTGDPAIRVLVIDVGVQSSHPDLNVTGGRDFTTGAIDGVQGGDPVNQWENHGTAVAGCISGRINNGIGTCGVAPACPAVSARCFVGNANGGWDANYSWTANALNWAASNGIRITNNSNWYGGTSAAVEAAYAATRQSGSIHFASAGNNGTSTVTYPASLAPVIAVGAATRNGTRATFSCFGPALDCLTPGASIFTTDRTGTAGYATGDYTTSNGTSFASPFAAGIAALMRSRDPAISPDEMTSILFSTARDMGLSGFDTGTGWGLLDAFAAVSALAAPCPADLDGDGAVGSVDLTILLAAWGGSDGGDIDRSGTVDAADLTTLLSAWGPCPG